MILFVMMAAMFPFAALLIWGSVRALRTRSYWDNRTMKWVPTESRAGYNGEAVCMAAFAILALAIPAIYWIKEVQ